MPDFHRTGDEDGREDADDYAVVSNDGGAEFNALRIIHRHSDYDAISYTVAEPYAHSHSHNHGGLIHGHQHSHSDEHVQHHPNSDHDGDTSTGAD